MDTSGEVADLMVKESIQVTEAGIKLLAAGQKPGGVPLGPSNT